MVKKYTIDIVTVACENNTCIPLYSNIFMELRFCTEGLK